MSVLMTRGVQVPLPLSPAPAVPAASPKRAPAGARPRRRGRPLRRPRLDPCPVCRGPLAMGEGYITCVVCGLRRAA